jgi:hypothetical protein
MLAVTPQKGTKVQIVEYLLVKLKQLAGIRRVDFVYFC